ncbi:HNH endonuclease signature motif containing protein [Burkholderia ubonensis]|uniref:HNH endonuclease signature motif containing protein n=1 Tax=Burkholderia ubonensis TaxID=101571 RepID=UPI00358E4000
MHFISYPRTAAELADLLKLGMSEVLRLLRENKLRVNLKGFLSYFFKTKNDDPAFISNANEKLLNWYAQRIEHGMPPAALVYHRTGVRALHGFKIERVSYVRKLDRRQYEHERKREFETIRPAWIREIGIKYAAELEGAGISRADIARMVETGKAPLGYQVHHRMPLDDGGTNAYENLILMRDDVEHRAVHGYYNPGEQRIDRMNYGEGGDVALPMPPADTIVYPNIAMGYVSEPVPNVKFLEIFE